MVVCRSAVVLRSPTHGDGVRTTFSGVLNEDATQDDVFDLIGQRLLDSWQSHSSSVIFAYGLSGSGKSHTLVGPDHDPGLVRRLARVVTESCTAATLSVLEIHNDKLIDLLGDESSSKRLRILSKPARRSALNVAGVSEHAVGDSDTAVALIDRVSDAAQVIMEIVLSVLVCRYQNNSM